MTGATLQEDQADLPSSKSTRSYWHREPSEMLLGHRTTRTLPTTADVVVVGSGITGAFAAKELKEGPGGKSRNVLLLEAREACWGATGRNGGHCQPMAYGPDHAIADFELRNYEYLRDFVAANSIPCDWVSLPGCHALFSPDLVAKAKEAIAALPPHLAGAACLVTNAEDLRALHIPGAVGAVVQENAASVWPYKLVCWVLEGLLASFGVAADGGLGRRHPEGWFNLQTSTPVTRLQQLSPDSHDGGAVWIVHTDRGQVATKQVLLASNAYTSRLLPSFSDLIVPVRGQVAALLPDPRTELGRSYVFMASSSGSEPNQDDYLIQRPRPGLDLILGGGRARGTARGVGVSDDDAVDPVVATYLRRAGSRNVDLEGAAGNGDGGGKGDVEAEEVNNNEKELEASYEWTGIMGFSRDGRPWVGEVPAGPFLGGGKGLWICAGYTGHGMPQAALSARAVAEMMTGQQDGVVVPAGFLVSEERARRAKALPGIREMDELDMFLL